MLVSVSVLENRCWSWTGVRQGSAVAEIRKTTATGATHDSGTLVERGHPRSVVDHHHHLLEAGHPVAGEGHHLVEQGHHQVVTDLHFATDHHSVAAVLEGMDHFLSTLLLFAYLKRLTRGDNDFFVIFDFLPSSQNLALWKIIPGHNHLHLLIVDNVVNLKYSFDIKPVLIGQLTYMSYTMSSYSQIFMYCQVRHSVL